MRNLLSFRSVIVTLEQVAWGVRNTIFAASSWSKTSVNQVVLGGEFPGLPPQSHHWHLGQGVPDNSTPKRIGDFSNTSSLNLSTCLTDVSSCLAHAHRLSQCLHVLSPFLVYVHDHSQDSSLHVFRCGRSFPSVNYLTHQTPLSRPALFSTDKAPAYLFHLSFHFHLLPELLHVQEFFTTCVRSLHTIIMSAPLTRNRPIQICHHFNT